MTVTAVEFIRRFMLHVLPARFRKIRHYGILAARDKSERISLCKKLTQTAFTEIPLMKALERLRKILGADFDLCPNCGIGHLSRASPETANAAA